MDTDPARPFPWREAMAFGLGVLRLRPSDFWAMTPREFAAAFAGAMPQPMRNVPMPRDALAALMKRFPDL